LVRTAQSRSRVDQAFDVDARSTSPILLKESLRRFFTISLMRTAPSIVPSISGPKSSVISSIRRQSYALQNCIFLRLRCSACEMGAPVTLVRA
jgi:hypothetical protein